MRSYSTFLNADLENWLMMKTGDMRITVELVRTMRKVFPQINESTRLTDRKACGPRRPGLQKVGYTPVYIEGAFSVPKQGLKAKLWRLWWAVWSHDEPMKGVLWDRGFDQVNQKMTHRQENWIKFEVFGWRDESFWAIQREGRRPEEFLIGYDPDKDEIYV